MGATRNFVAAAIATALTFAAAGGVGHADTAVADSDTAVAGVGTLSFGDVCVGTTVSKPITLIVTRSAGGSNAFRNGTSITVVHSAFDATGLSATDPATSNAPSTWIQQPNGSTFTRSSTLTLVAGPTVRSVSDETTYKLSGVDNTGGSGNPISLLAPLTVTADVVVCDTTAPTINVPASIVAEATGPTGASVSYTVTADDANPAHPAVSCAPASGSVFALGTTTVDCTSTDDFDNTATASFTVTVQDTLPPVISSTPTDIVTEAINADGATVSFTNPTALDAVSGVVPVTCTPASGATLPLGSSMVSCSASDAAGHTATSSFQVVVEDTTAPVLVVPDPLTVEATGSTGAVATFDASASDSVTGVLTPMCSPPSGSTFDLGATNVDCTATDAAGNTGSATFQVTVRDTTAPSVSVPGSFTAAAVDGAGAHVTFVSSAGDAVSGSLATTCTRASGSLFPLGATTVTCTATDAAGNTGSAMFVVTVTDQHPPTLQLPADVLEEASSPDGNAISFTVGAVDNVDGPVAVSCSSVSGTVFPVATTIVECTASDGAGNLATGAFAVAIVDTTSPLISVPGPIVAEATGPSGATVEFDVTASDIVDRDVAPICAPASGAIFALGTTTVSCTATDDAGNEATDGFDVTVQDTTPPLITGTPTDMTVEAANADGAQVTFTNPTATDLVDGEVMVSCVPPSNSTFLLDVTTSVECTATDAAGNSATSTFVITVHDTTAPMLALPSDITAEATSPAGAIATFAPTATDLVDGDIEVICTPPSGTQFPLGSSLVECTATDAHDNAAGGGFTVTVVDTTPPVLDLPADQIAEATGSGGAVVTFAATADDIADTDVAALCTPASGTTFPIGSTTVACTATDDSGNTSEASFEVEVRDTTPPALSVPEDTSVEATGPDGAAVAYTATAFDLVDGVVTANCAPATGASFPLGTTTVTCVATDSRTNSASATFSVTVTDTTAPALSLPTSFSVEATGPAGATATFAADATDLVDGAVIVTCTPSSGSTFALGETNVSCSATDDATNTATAGFMVTVTDTTPPAIAGTPSDLVAEATGSTGAVVTYTNPTAIDLVDGPVAVDCDPGSGSLFPLDQSTPVTCSATDAHANESQSGFHIFVADRTSPVLTLPSDLTFEATGPAGAVVPFEPSAFDLVDGDVPVQCVPPSGSQFALGEHAVECVTEDAHGNSESGSFTVTVVDTTAPTLVAPGDITQEATGPGGAIVSFTASADDIVDGARDVGCTPSSGSMFPIGSTPVTCTAVDAAGNTGSATFDVLVRDTTAPQVEDRADITVDPTGLSGAPVAYPALGAVDIVDGNMIAPCAPPSGTTFPFGTTTVTCSATDLAGNTGTARFDVTVRALRVTGFYQPVDMSGAWNTVKGGSTVPLKFEIFAGATELATIAAVKSFTQRLVTCAGTSLEEAIDVVTTGGTTLRYDGTSGQFVQNWQTPKKPGSCYQVTMTAADGTTIVANFKLK